jgi:hypothetical protein
MVLTSCLLLVYTALFVPMQLSFWQSSDPCYVAPTLYFDLFTDLYFMVPVPCRLAVFPCLPSFLQNKCRYQDASLEAPLNPCFPSSSTPSLTRISTSSSSQRSCLLADSSSPYVPPSIPTPQLESLLCSLHNLKHR